jgi:hypothetical protein
MRRHRCWTLGRCGAVTVVLLLGMTSAAAVAQPLDMAARRAFMLTAEIVGEERIGKGVTEPWRLTLSDGTLTHDVGFQSVDERRDQARLRGRVELGFIDAYRYNVAAYKVAELVGLADMIPVTVERRWKSQPGAMTWWVDDVMLDEAARLAERRWPDDMLRFNEQHARMRMFAELVYDTDRNHGNILYDTDWRLWMIDFSRAFRIWGDLRAPQSLTRCDRSVLRLMRTLTRESLRQHAGEHLNPGEVDAVLERRDKLVRHFDALIAQRGEAAVLFD